MFSVPPRFSTLRMDFLDGKSFSAILERPLSDQERDLLTMTEKAARRHGFHTLLDYLGGIPEEVLRRLAKLKAEAKRNGVSSETFHQFMDFLFYIKKISTHAPCHRDFYNDLLIAGNTIALRVQDLFNAGETLSVDGVRCNGIFGKQGILKREKDLVHVDDLMPFLYTVHSTIAKGNPLPAYFLFFGETPNPVRGHHPMLDQSGKKVFLEYNSGPWFNANLVLERTEKFIDEAVNMSLDVTRDGIILVDHNQKPYFLPIISAIYDLDSMTMWRVERINTHIYAQRLDEWFVENIDTFVYDDLPMFTRRDIIEKHIERLTAHANHGSEHMQLRIASLKKVGCVDGRQDNSKSEIGCLIGDRQLNHLVGDNSTTQIHLCFHTECGYINTAISLHKIFRAMKKGIDPKDRVTIERAQIFIDTLTKKPWISRDESLFREFIRHVDLSKVSSDPKVQKYFATQLHDLITDNQGSLRYATSHMLDRRVFTIEDGYPVMTAAKNVEEAVAKHGLSFSEEFFHIVCVEEVVRLDRLYKCKWLQENQSLVASQRVDGKMPNLAWMIEDLASGRFYQVPEKPIKEQSIDEAKSTMRKDYITGCMFDMNREFANAKLAAMARARSGDFDHLSHDHDHDHDE